MNQVVLRDGITQDFIEVTEKVLSTMAGLEVSHTSSSIVDESVNGLNITSCLDITGFVGFSGGAKGSVLITLSKDMALATVGGMLGVEFQEIDSDVGDGIGELINMVAGGAKTKLQERGIDFELSIANTVMGSDYQVTIPPGTNGIRLNFNSSAGKFFMEIFFQKIFDGKPHLCNQV